MDYQRIGQRIRAIRKQKNLHQEKLAEAVGVGTSHISHVETVQKIEIYYKMIGYKMIGFFQLPTKNPTAQLSRSRGRQGPRGKQKRVPLL